MLKSSVLERVKYLQRFIASIQAILYFGMMLKRADTLHPLIFFLRGLHGCNGSILYNYRNFLKCRRFGTMLCRPGFLSFQIRMTLILKTVIKNTFFRTVYPKINKKKADINPGSDSRHFVTMLLYPLPKP